MNGSIVDTPKWFNHRKNSWALTITTIIVRMNKEDTILSAVKSGDTTRVRQLIDQVGAKVNTLGIGSRTPIFYAENVDIMQMLIANGAQVNLKDRDGWTPLHVFAYSGRGDVACCELLLCNNADIEATANCGATPLHLAADYYSRNAQTVELLVAHQRSRYGAAGVGSLFVRTTRGGRNTLHYCALYNATSGRARLLVEHCRGEDGELLSACHQIMITRDSNGNTPLDLAKRNYSSEVLEYLKPFTTLPLAASPDDCGLAVMLNPKLDDFQRAIATDCLALIHMCCVDIPDAVVYILLGYLSSCDVMKR